MYVRDLEEGCLLKCNRQDFLFGLQAVDLQHMSHETEGIQELEGLGIQYTAHPTKFPCWTGIRKRFHSFHSLAIYTGPIKLSNYFFGVKTIHTFIVNGMSVVMDGYQVKDLEKIE